MEQEKISIIIPVYQVEEYLPKCINSVIKQTYKNLEILLIDDGSPDASGKICDAFAKKDSRIRVIHKENAGVAMARNTGLDLATGNYISFIDSDDWISKDAYENLYHGLKKYQADCAIGHCVTVIDKNGRLMRKKESLHGKPAFDKKIHQKSAREMMKQTLLDRSAIWNMLFKKEIFENLRFPAGRINDDEVTALHAYAKCKKIVLLPEDSYFYRIRENSITTSKFSLRHLDFYYNSKDNLAFTKKVMPDLVSCAEFKTYKTLLYCYLHLLSMTNEREIAKLKKILHQEIFRVRSAAFRNPYVTLPMKLAFIFCSIF